MASTRIFVSYATTKSSRNERDIAAQFILDLQTARAEVITASESIFDENFMQFLYTELPRCQYVILVQNEEAIQSPRVQSTINLALTLVSQGRIKEVLRLVVAPLSPDREPPTVAKLRTFDATQDYLRARDRLLLYLDLLTLEKDPDETFIASRDISSRTADEGAPIASMSGSSPNNATPMVTRYNTPPAESYVPGGAHNRKEQFYPNQNEPPAQAPAAKTAQSTPPKEERNGKFLSGRSKQSQIDRPVPLRDRYQIAPIWVIIFSSLQVLTLLFAIGVLIWGRTPATNTAPVVKATPTAAPSSFTSQLNTLIEAATQSQKNPYGKSNKLVVNDALDNTSTTSNDNSWDTLNNKALSCQFANQTYVVTTHGPGSCLATKTNYKDLTYQVQMTITQGQAGGLVFRDNTNISQPAYFKFIITTNGNYIIERNDRDDLDYQIQSGFSPAIRQGLNQANLIAVNATGQTLDFYVNLQHVATIQDNHNLAPGSIGVTASGPNEDFTTQVLFKYAKVWSSEEQNN